MNDIFELPVTYKNEELCFQARLSRRGYSYKMDVEVKGQSIIFEPDEEGNWRALLDPSVPDKNKPDTELLKAICVSIEFLME